MNDLVGAKQKEHFYIEGELENKCTMLAWKFK